MRQKKNIDCLIFFRKMDFMYIGDDVMDIIILHCFESRRIWIGCNVDLKTGQNWSTYVEQRKPATVFRLSETCKEMKNKTNAHLDDYVRNYNQNAHYIDYCDLYAKPIYNVGFGKSILQDVLCQLHLSSKQIGLKISSELRGSHEHSTVSYN